MQSGPQDMSGFMEQAQRMQEQLMKAQQQMAAAEIVGEAGGGLVRITMTGSGATQSVSIDPKVVDPDDVETLQDLIVGAYNDAAQKVAAFAQSQLGGLSSLAQGLDDSLGL